MSILHEIRGQLPAVFTANEAMLVLSKQYKSPHKALELMAKKGKVLRVKRDLYVLPENYDPLLVSSRLYEPSYISFETALYFYGLIPERTEAIISVTDARPNKILSCGTLYYYRSQGRLLYSMGMTCINIKDQLLYIATKEKALFDTLAYQKLKTKDLKPEDILNYVLGSMRIDENEIYSLSRRKLSSLSGLYRNKAPELLLKALKKKKD